MNERERERKCVGEKNRGRIQLGDESEFSEEEKKEREDVIERLFGIFWRPVTIQIDKIHETTEAFEIWSKEKRVSAFLFQHKCPPARTKNIACGLATSL